MDLNLVVLSGRIVAPPEYITHSHGGETRRLLVSTRTEHPRRLDVIRVVDGAAATRPTLDLGDDVIVVGRIERRVHDGPTTRETRFDVAAMAVATTGVGSTTR